MDLDLSKHFPSLPPQMIKKFYNPFESKIFELHVNS